MAKDKTIKTVGARLDEIKWGPIEVPLIPAIIDSIKMSGHELIVFNYDLMGDGKKEIHIEVKEIPKHEPSINRDRNAQ